MKTITPIEETGRPRMTTVIALAVGIHLALGTAGVALAEAPAWQPSATEKLVKLPASYLKKAIDRDFAESGLAMALNDTTSQIGLKSQTLSDLQAAIDQAEGEVRTELRHQFLAEKREFINLMGERQELRKKQIKTKVRLYERLLRKLERRERGQSPAKVALLEKQSEARQRFENSVAAVDIKLFGSTIEGESKYHKEYAKNMAAIESLVSAIKDHPMNAEPEINGEPVSKPEYLRQLIAENEATLAIVDQEENILGYMAKLVALDAMSLSEEVAGGEFADGVTDEEGELSISSAVDLFITQ